MNKIFLLLFLLMISQLVKAQEPAISKSIEFEERIYNFGTILEKDGKVSHKFVFHNRGNAPVAISEIYSGCGCIGKVVKQDAVPPGSKGEVTIEFNPEYKSGFFSKEIVVFSNNNKEISRIWVEGDIKPMEHPIEHSYPYNFGNGLYLRLKVVALGYLNPGERKVVELHYANNSDKEIDLKFVPQGYRQGLLFQNPGKLKPKEKGVIQFAFTMPFNTLTDVSIKLDPIVGNQKLNQTLEIKALHPLNKNKAKAVQVSD